MSSTTQQLRAGIGDDGAVFLGLDVLATDRKHKPLDCDAGELAVQVAYSTTGEQGPFLDLPDDRVTVQCGSDQAGDFALVVDNSGSEEGLLQELKHSARDVIHRLLPLGGRASVVRVSTEAAVLSEVTDDRPALEASLNSMRVRNGWTALYDGIRMGNETLGRAAHGQQEDRFNEQNAFCAASQKLGVIAITDGGENNSSGQKLVSERYPGDGFDTDLDDLKNLAVGGVSTPIYTIGLGSKVDHEGLAELAAHTGGRHMRIDDRNDIPAAFDVVADYAQSHHQVCTAFPEPVCGPVHVRVTHRVTYRQGNKNRETSGERVYHLSVPCASEPENPATAGGRVVTVLAALSDLQMDRASRERLIAGIPALASDVQAPRILLVADDSHHGEHRGDTAYVRDTLVAAGHDVTMIDEPRRGLAQGDVEGYELVWFANPGSPMDDLSSLQVLQQFADSGGAVVMQGDDMGASYGHAFSMTDLTGLAYEGSGVRFCGKRMDNGTRPYTLFWDSPLSTVGGPGSMPMSYADDIDAVSIASQSAQVLLWATADHAKPDGSCADQPVIVVHHR